MTYQFKYEELGPGYGRYFLPAEMMKLGKRLFISKEDVPVKKPLGCVSLKSGNWIYGLK